MIILMDSDPYLVEILRNWHLASVVVQENVPEAIAAVAQLRHAERACVDDGVKGAGGYTSTEVLESEIMFINLRL